MQKLSQSTTERSITAEYISDDGFFITEACREYLSPLIQGEDYPSYTNGLPDYVVLQKHKLAKKLPNFDVK